MKITPSCGRILSLARQFKRCLAAGLLLASGLGVAQAQVSYTGADDVQYVQNFTSLPVSGSITWANNSTVPGWYARCQSSSPVPTTCLTSPTNASNTVFSYGPSGATAGTPRALGMYAASSTGNPTLAVRIRNNTGRTLTSFRYQFVGQQWRSDETHKETMNFSYQLATSNNTVPADPLTTSGTWSTANVYYAISIGTYGFFSQNMSASGNIDGTNPANQDRYCSATVTNISWANGQDLWLSWTGNSNYYQGLGIANFSFSASDVDAGVAQYRQTAFDELAHTDDQISGGGAEPREVARAAYYALALDTNPTPGDASVERSEGYMTTIFNSIGSNGCFPSSIGGAGQSSTGENNFVDVPLGIIFTRYNQYLDSSFVTYATPILESAVTAQDNSTEFGAGYTNMFCGQTASQLLLGEALNDTASAHAGAANFKTLLDYTTQQGIYQEYDSSNYSEISYVDMLAAYNNTTDSTSKARLLTLLQYYATDLAATYFPGRQVLAGAQSRDYDRPGNSWENTDDFYYLEGFSSNAEPQNDIGYNGIGLVHYCNDYVEGGFTVQNNAAWAMNIPPTTGGNVITERMKFNTTTGAPVGWDRYTYITPGYAIGSSSFAEAGNNEADAQITADLAGSLGMGRVTVLFGDQDGGGNPLANYASTVQSQNFILSLNNLYSYSQAFNDVDYNIDFPLSVDAMYYSSSATGSTIQVVNNPASVAQGTIYPPTTAAPLSTDSVVAIRKGNNVIAYRMFQVDGIAGNTPSPAYIKFDGGSNMGRLVVYAYPVQSGTPPTVNTNPMARVGIVMAATTLTGTGTQDAQAEAFLTSMLNMTFNSSMNGTVWNVYTSLNHVWLNASLDTNRSAANNCVVNREVDSAGYIPDRFTVDNGTTATDYATQIMGPVIATPTGCTASPGNAQVALSWNTVSGASSYNVYRSTTNGGPYTALVSGLTTASYTDTSAANGTTYYYVVTAWIPAGESPQSAQVGATPEPPPATPTGVTTTPGNGQVTVNWNADTNAQTYNIIRQNLTTSSGWSTLVTGLTGTSYTDTTTVNGDAYQYVVVAVDPAGSSGWSSVSGATPEAPPAAPAGFIATPGNAQVALTWTAATNAASYNIGRATTSGGPYTTVGTATTTTYTDTTVTNGTTYYYVVAGVDVGGTGANSAEVSATPLAPPAAPTGFSASPGNAQVALTWTAATNAASYNIGRATTSGGPYTTIGTATTTSYNDTTTTNGTIYYYVVSGVDVGGTGANSAEVNATPLAPPAAPAGLSASPGNAQVGLTWTAATNAASYNIGRATTSGGPYTTIGTATTTSYTDTTATNGTTYYYVVAGVDVGGTGANSAEVSATPLAPPAPPAALGATPGNAQVGLTWTAATNAASYNIGRATTSGGPYTTIGTATTTSYNDTTAANGTTYYYVVAGVDVGGTGANSAEVNATPLAPPVPPAALGATPGNAQVALTWTAATNAASYNIGRATTSGGPYTTIATAITTSYNDTIVTNGTTYYYVVSGVDVGGTGANSAEVSATPLAPPAAPSGFSASPGNAQVGLTWTAATNAASYNIGRATTSGGPYTTIGTATTTSYTDTTTTNGTIYYYVVSGVDVGGTGANSAEVNATPLAPPAAPAGLSASPGNAQVGLTWTAATNAASYNIGRATTSGGPYTTIGTATTTSYTDTTATNGTTYYYVVASVDVGGTGANSAQASATPLAPPAAPAGFIATPGNARVALTWTASTNAASYNIGRATTSGGPYTTIGTVTTTNYADTTVTNGTTYYYVVSGVDGSGTGANSAQASAKPTASGLIGPVGYWQFGEGTGTATADASGKGINGTLSSSAMWTTSGKFGDALTFNGTSNTVSLNDASTTSALKPTLPVTVSAWIKVGSTSGDQTIFASDTWNSTYAGFNLQLISGVLECSYGDGGNAASGNRRTKTGTTVLSTGVWYHVAATIQSATSMNLYVNGVDNGGTYSGTGGTMVYTTAASTISGSGGADYFNGTIDDVRVYNRSLSSTEVGLLANPPVSEWRFGENTGTTAYDSGTAGIAGTLTNSPTWTSGWFGDALSFNGASSYVSLNDASTTSALKPAFPVSVSAWIYLSSTSGTRMIFASDEWDTTKYAGYNVMVSGGLLACQYGNAGGNGTANRYTYTGATVLNTGQWYYVTAVIANATTINLYVNGVADTGSSSGTATTMGYTTTASEIGAASAANVFAGVLDDVRVYNYALSATQAGTLNNAASGVIPPQ